MVEALHQLRAHHGEVLAQGGVLNLDEERLVLDEYLRRIAGCHRACHLAPVVDEALLEQWGFQSLPAEELGEEGFDARDAFPKHGPCPP